ncbi:MAG: adenylate/guanylate cyclase domain-containing protein [Hyphomicrobiales bacterium]|nr:adenylate/guanylate cyclase domain-containing protein [Hyphomicrobiales bacterium]
MVITFEVHVLRQGEWSVHSRHAENSFEQALRAAKGLERLPTTDGVKVVRDEYNSQTGRSKTKTEYGAGGAAPDAHRATDKPPTQMEANWGPDPMPETASRPSGAAPSAPRGPNGTSGRSGRSFSSPYRARKADKGRSTPGSVATKIVLIITLSLTVAAVVTAIASLTLDNPAMMGTAFSGSTKANTLFGIFVVSFLFTAIPTSMVYLSKDELGVKDRPEEPPVKDLIIDPDDLDLPSHDGDEAEDPLLPGGADAAEEAPEPEPEAAGEAAEAPLSAEAEEQRKGFLRFLAETLGVLQGTKQRLDSYEKFGVNLFMAGACETLSQSSSLEEGVTERILTQGLEVMGMNTDQAAAFVDRYEGYLLGDPRYLRMFDAGREAMTASLSGDTGHEDALNIALEGWNAPQDENLYSGPLTVLFTDIAGSTNMTQQLGDSGAQEVVRAHNTIVRSALGRFNGREIKHTGDGIMASFVKTSAAVEAAIRMQVESETFTRDHPKTPLRLKIGINAGEPIAEDDDLFGSMVQMSARIVDKAKGGEIMVSDVVRALCAGKDLRFTNRGTFDLKGFEGPSVLYEIVWNDDRPAAAAPPPPQPPAADEGAMPPPPEAPTLEAPPPESAPPETRHAEAPAPAAETAGAETPETPAQDGPDPDKS